MLAATCLTCKSQVRHHRTPSRLYDLHCARPSSEYDVRAHIVLCCVALILMLITMQSNARIGLDSILEFLCVNCVLAYWYCIIIVVLVWLQYIPFAS